MGDTLDDIKRLIETPGFEKLEIGLEEVTFQISGENTYARFRVGTEEEVPREVLGNAIHILVPDAVLEEHAPNPDCPACLGGGTISGGHDCACQYE